MSKPDISASGAQRRGFLQRLAGLGTLFGVSANATASATPGAATQTITDHVVYHIDAIERAIPMIRNIGNHLDARPDTRIAVVALGKGIDFLIDGTEDPRGNPYNALVDTLQLRGVVFKICRNSMDTRHLTAEDLVPDVEIVRSGVAELARLQCTEHYAYIKP